ncbi:helix-turn-helix transcriptional regulator [Geobacter pickeringii]|uniref:helix-turn-helix transcriptional regulator n=1 Tax=Geobacter pickeringii TaxID=345632 RepID=UPI000A038C44|nr:AlpA family phage regulatory protein [Geobacter pickeringii]
MQRITVEPGNRILRNPDLDVITGLSRTTRWRLENAGDFPKRRQISKGAVGWIESEVTAWLLSKGLASADRQPQAA